MQQRVLSSLCRGHGAVDCKLSLSPPSLSLAFSFPLSLDH
uniref:Uncharacterized protein n=1 Tax=Anguilla anguilla TaxID=7936 RepID=A0A0E9WAS7_ANGAN